MGSSRIGHAKKWRKKQGANLTRVIGHVVIEELADVVVNVPPFSHHRGESHRSLGINGVTPLGT
jgi:hypothetical protein